MFSGEQQKTNYSFSTQESPIILGRGKSCRVKIDSNFLSKKHTTVQYNKKTKNWEIQDGYEKHPSLNGTWLWLNTKYELKETTYIKVGNNIIRLYYE